MTVRSNDHASKTTFRRAITGGVIAVTTLLASAGAANAQLNPSDPYITVRATTPGGLDGWLTIPLIQAGITATGFEWNLAIQGGGIPITITDTITSAPIATVSQLRSAVSTLPSGVQSVQLSFVTTAGSSAATFSFSSPLVGFPTIFPAEGRATASIGCTDSNGDGALMTYLGLGGTAYLAEMNGMGALAPDFANLIPGGGMAAGSFLSNSATENLAPAPGVFIPIGIAVSSMHTQYDFSLSAFDQASGSSNFFVRVPAPGAVSLLGLAGLVGLRRRR